MYRGDAIPGLYGWYLYGDYCSGFIDAVPADDPTAEPGAARSRTSGNVISFGELEDGELVVLTAAGRRSGSDAPA